MLTYVVAIILVLIIIAIVVRKIWLCKQMRNVRFGEDEILLFDKSQPPLRCRKIDDYVNAKKNRYEWLKIHMPATMKHMMDREIPGFDDSATRFHEFDEFDEITMAGNSRRRHRPFTSAATTASHIELSGFDTSGRELI